MARNNNKIKYLSQSVLLEEKGLPGLNVLIVLIVALMLTAFIGWSMLMEIEDTVNVSGFVPDAATVDGYTTVTALIPSNDLLKIKEGYKASVSIPGLTTNKPFQGRVGSVEGTTPLRMDNKVFYEVSVELNDSQAASQLDKAQFVSGMEATIHIVVGSRTFFNYFLGPVFNSVQ